MRGMLAQRPTLWGIEPDASAPQRVAAGADAASDTGSNTVLLAICASARHPDEVGTYVVSAGRAPDRCGPLVEERPPWPSLPTWKLRNLATECTDLHLTSAKDQFRLRYLKQSGALGVDRLGATGKISCLDHTEPTHSPTVTVAVLIELRPELVRPRDCPYRQEAVPAERHEDVVPDGESVDEVQKHLRVMTGSRTAS